jgi:flagellar biosynthetic protein FliS
MDGALERLAQARACIRPAVGVENNRQSDLLQAAISILDELRAGLDLAVQANNSSLSASERQNIAAQLQQQLQQHRHGEHRRLFAGLGHQCGRFYWCHGDRGCDYAGTAGGQLVIGGTVTNSGLTAATTVSALSGPSIANTNVLTVAAKLLHGCVKIIGELRGILNTAEGGTIAQNLSDLYDYRIRRLLRANLETNVACITEVLDLLSEIRKAWFAIGPEVRQSVRHAVGAR